MNTFQKVIFTTFVTGESQLSLDVMRKRFAGLAPAVAQQVVSEVMTNLKLPEILEPHRSAIEQACIADCENYFLSKVEFAYRTLADMRKGMVN
jgi:hypothetical protein